MEKISIYQQRYSDIIHLMSAREENSFVFPRDSMFPETKSRETLSFEAKQNYFPREQTLSVLLYSDEIKITAKSIHTTIAFCDKNNTK